MTHGLDPRAEPAWFIHAQGRVWGPYPQSRIEGFVQEGRVSGGAMLSHSPDGGFKPADQQAPLAHLFRRPSAAPVHTPVAPQPVAESSAERPLLVFAELSTLEEGAFEAVLTLYGACERVGRGMWLVRARTGPAALRNALSRRLRGGDTLLVVEATLDHAAWFNLDQAEERKLRALWAG